MNVVRLEVDFGRLEALDALGCRERQPPRRLMRSMEECLDLLKGVDGPCFAHRRVVLEHQEDGVLMDGRGRPASRVLRSVLANCSAAVVYVATLGSEVDSLIDEVSAVSAHDGFVIDALASRLAEDAADRFHRWIVSRLELDESATPPYSPGYCDWPVTDQRLLFGILDCEAIGVRLTEDCLMQPRKSVSGVIGIGRRAELEHATSSCRICRKKNCDHRRE